MTASYAKGERIHSLDALKMVMALLVVVFHSYDFRYNGALWPVHRILIPCFFMISGFLLYDGATMDPARLRRGAAHMLRLLVGFTVLYCLARIAYNWATDTPQYVPSRRDWAEFLVLGNNPFCDHLWYIQAYALVLVTMAVVAARRWWRWAWALLPVLLLADLWTAQYQHLLHHVRFKDIYVCNFLFPGLPFFLLGALIRRYASRLVRPGLLPWLVAGALAAMLLARYEESVFEAARGYRGVLNTGNVLTAVFVLLAVLNLRVSPDNLAARMGRRDSLHVYLYHALATDTVMPYVNTLMPAWWLDAYPYFCPLATIGVTFAIVCGVRAVRGSKINIFRRKNKKTLEYDTDTCPKP